MNRWLVAMTVMLPTLIEIIDTSVVNVSLDHIRGTLSAGIDEATWAITAYLVSNAIIIPITGWLSRIFGRKNYLVASIVLFTASSFLCGSAWSLRSLIFFRIIQGIGGGGLQPLSQSILLEEFPPAQHGRAMAIFGIGIMFGPIVGPLLGGWITDNWSWRWIFYINVPIGILSIILTLFIIKDPPYMKRMKMRIDYPGLIFLALGLGSLQFVLDKGQREDWFSSHIIVAFAVISVAALMVFVIVELLSKQPVVNLRLFKDRTFTTGNMLMFFAFFNLFASIVLLPIYLQTLMGYTAFLAGVVLGPGGLATMVALPIAGRLVEKRNPKVVLLAGIFISGLATYMMSRFNLQAGFWTLVWPRVVLGVGMGFLFIPLTTLTLSHIPKEHMTEATAMYNLLRNIGGSVGVAFVTTTLARRAQFHQTRLAEHINPYSQPYRITAEHINSFLASRGIENVSPDRLIHFELIRQSHMLAFNDAFLLVSLLMAAILPMVFLMKRNKAGKIALIH
ncbi:MAG TPA: DHA2 family efflux MFS transporter permease subunit [Nitrospirae bacterium]|nr:DHA2 family efflux MFS transporter permease subunit [Nitrospirota bacterium]HDY71235.1 DHA2 family efflux MFS transporter permease subunit [Nitrospirota bacterium]